MRPTRDQMLMEVATVIASRGTCERARVGAVIAREGRIISIGYNGAPPGQLHCDENQHGWLPFTLESRESTVEALLEAGAKISTDTRPMKDTDLEIASLAVQHFGCRNAIHAEMNALLFAARYGIPTDEAQLFVTYSPCEYCARAAVSAGISKVYYHHLYRDVAPLDFLAKAGVFVDSITI